MIQPSLKYEQVAWQKDYRVVVGVDEVGRGAWAGPVIAAAVQLPKQAVCYGRPLINQDAVQLPQFLRDSKKLSPLQRNQLNADIRTIAEQVAIGMVEVEEINRMGVGKANFLAMNRALSQLTTQPDFILIDGFEHPDINPNQQLAIVKGDSLVASIAAASIIAKVYRDNLMTQLAAEYPNYGLDQHKGYGTHAHQEAIKTYGLSSIHRRNFNLKFLVNLNKDSA
jgi:ribonuclease HII